MYVTNKASCKAHLSLTLAPRINRLICKSSNNITLHLLIVRIGLNGVHLHTIYKVMFMIKTLTQDNFKATAKAIRSDLDACNISLKLRKSYDLLSYVLNEKHWTALSPALPKKFGIPGDKEAGQMKSWLLARHKTIDISTCLSILQSAFIESTTGWFYSDRLSNLNSKPTPLFDHTDQYDRINDATIIINPEKRIIDTASWDNDGAPMRVYGRIYAFKVPGDIPGCALVRILTHQKFLSLIELISENYSLDWDGHNHRGILTDEGELSFKKLYKWIFVNTNTTEYLDFSPEEVAEHMLEGFDS